MGNKKVLEIDVTKTGEAMKKRDHDRIIVRLGALGNFYTSTDKKKRHAIQLFIAVRLCAQHNIPIPRWVADACAYIADTIPDKSSWHDVLGPIDAEGFRAARSSEPVGKSMIVAEMLGVPVRAAKKIIADISDGAVGVREVAPAFEYYKVTSGCEEADNPAKISRPNSGDRNDQEKQDVEMAKAKAETKLIRFAKKQFKSHPVVKRPLKKRTQRDEAA
jgi:hypothetical protein